MPLISIQKKLGGIAIFARSKNIETDCTPLTEISSFVPTSYRDGDEYTSVKQKIFYKNYKLSPNKEVVRYNCSLPILLPIFTKNQKKKKKLFFLNFTMIFLQRF